MVAGVLLILSLMPFAAANKLTQLCGNGGNYPADGAYNSSLALLAATLPSNASSSPELFATATAGQAPDVVFALALCRGDVNATVCSRCVAASFQDARQACPHDRGATTFDDDCLLRFSGDDFLVPPNVTENGTLFRLWNGNKIEGGDARLIAGDVRELLLETARRAATTARRFATGFMNTTRTTPRLYSLAQCTPDLDASDCLSCLGRIIAMMDDGSGSTPVGGRNLVVRCNFRYETYAFYNGEPMLQVRSSGAPPPVPAATAPSSTKGHSSRKPWKIAVSVLAPLALVVFCFILYCCWRRRDTKGKVDLRGNSKELHGGDELIWEMEGDISELSVFGFDQILEATGNFSKENKLGEGGSGPVYKGQFCEGLEIAVKRLSSSSGQGFIELKNEVQIIAKLQHRNLVKLLGCCSQGEEKILVYEYLANKSLDFFIFDENRKALLDWNKRLVIIEGIAQGILYLHKHSRLLIIHRDLKPSNILLDSEMNPKIADFGVAKIIGSNNNEGTTRRVVGRRIVGTYGYMAPEYASEGLFSIKSDVFSFGVIILEILSGKRNSGSDQVGEFVNLLGYSWKLFAEGRWIELVDVSLIPKFQSSSMIRCINIALLCVQDSAIDRPTMLDVVAMLNSESMVLTEPKCPTYSHVSVPNKDAYI